MGYIVILWCIMVSLIYIIIQGVDQKSMDVAGWVAIGVALIGVAGGIWAQVCQFKKDAQRIDGVNATSKDIKNDTTEMKPKVEDIKNTCKETNDCITKRLEPNIHNILTSVQNELKDNVAFLTEDLKFRQRLENEYKGIRNRAMIEGGIKELYDENALLTAENRELEKKIEHLTLENSRYVTINTQLKEKIQELEYQLQPEIEQTKTNTKQQDIIL